MQFPHLDIQPGMMCQLRNGNTVIARETPHTQQIGPKSPIPGWGPSSRVQSPGRRNGNLCQNFRCRFLLETGSRRAGVKFPPIYRERDIS